MFGIVLMMNLPRTLCLLKCELGELWSSQCAGFLQVSVMLGHTLEEFLIDVTCQFVDCDFGSTKVQNMSANILWDVCFGLSEYDCPGCVRAERGMVSYIPAENAGVVIVRAYNDMRRDRYILRLVTFPALTPKGVRDLLRVDQPI